MPGGTSSTGPRSIRGSADLFGLVGQVRQVGLVGETHPTHLPNPSHLPHPPTRMSLSTVLFFFLAHLGVGIAFTLLFVDREAGVKFFRFNGGLAAVLLGIALAFRFQEVASVAAFMAGENSGGVGAISLGIGIIR